MIQTRDALHHLFSAYLAKKGAQAAAGILASLSKADDTDEADEERRRKLHAALDNMNLDWSDLPGDVRAILEPFTQGAAQDGLHQIEVTASTSVELANERAVEWAANRAAEMVGMKYTTEGLVPNPNAEWRIDEHTRDVVGDLVTQAIEEGWSNDRLTEAIAGDTYFSDERAEMIARTETAMADVQGNVVAYKAAQENGIELMKEWWTANDADVSEDCEANQKQGAIPLDDTFQSGADAPPDHPNCRCDLIPIRVDKSADTQENDDS